MAAIDPQTLRGDWSYPTRVRFGPGRIAELPDACRALGIARPLLITDPGLAQHAIGQSVLEIARGAGLAVDLFADVRPNPIEANVTAGVERFRAGGHDGVIALGGGSGLDAAKAVAFMAGQTRPLWAFEDRGDNWTRARTAGIAPVLAIPTTAGTGSEVGRAAVITNEATHTKCILFHPAMLPGQVIADPELTLDLPAPLQDPLPVSRDRLGRRGAKRHDHLRPDQIPLDVQPPLAALDLMRIRPLMQAPLAARHELEMLDRIGDIIAVPVDVGLFQHGIEQATGRKADIDFQPMQPGDVKDTFADISAIRRDHGFEPSTAIDVGVPRFVDWFKQYHRID